MHQGDRGLLLGGEIHEVAPGSFLGGEPLAEQLTLSVHLADDQEGYDERWEDAEAEGEEELHG